MTDINSVTLVGRLSQPQKLSYTQTGTAKLDFSIYARKSIKHGGEWEEEFYYFDVVYWGTPAERINQYLFKGTQVAIDGYLKQNRWQKDGKNFSKICVIADSVQLLSNSNNQQQTQAIQQAPNNNQPIDANYFKPKQQPQIAPQDNFEADNSEIPF